MDSVNEARSTPAGDVIMEIAQKYSAHTRADVRRRIKEATGVEILRQQFDQWITGQASFSNDFAELFSRSFPLSEADVIKVSLALAYGQRTRRLRPATSPDQAAAGSGK